MSLLMMSFWGIVNPVLAICLAVLGLVTISTNLLGWFLSSFAPLIPAIHSYRWGSAWDIRAGSAQAKQEQGDPEEADHA